MDLPGVAELSSSRRHATSVRDVQCHMTTWFGGDATEASGCGAAARASTIDGPHRPSSHRGVVEEEHPAGGGRRQLTVVDETAHLRRRHVQHRRRLLRRQHPPSSSTRSGTSTHVVITGRPARRLARRRSGSGGDRMPPARRPAAAPRAALTVGRSLHSALLAVNDVNNAMNNVHGLSRRTDVAVKS